MMKIPTKLATLLLLLTCNVDAGESCITHESDPDNDGLGWENGGTCRVTDQTGVVPSLQDPRTGNSLNMQRLRWAWQDFSGKTFGFCHGYTVDPAQQDEICESCENHAQNEITYRYEHYNDGNGRLYYSSKSQSYEAEFTWSVDLLGLYTGPLPLEPYGQVFNDEVKLWLGGEKDKIGFYSRCDGAIASSMLDNNSASLVDLPENTPSPKGLICLDSDNDGWGWNGESSCRMPINVAEQQHISNETISPLASVTLGCHDPDGDGWGWDGYRTCIP